MSSSRWQGAFAIRATALLPVMLGAAFGCGTERATPAQCREIFDRIVAIELEEMGFADPELASRKQASLAALYAGRLQECVGRRLPSEALRCVATAKSTEALSHKCLR